MRAAEEGGRGTKRGRRAAGGRLMGRKAGRTPRGRRGTKHKGLWGSWGSGHSGMRDKRELASKGGERGGSREKGVVWDR